MCCAATPIHVFLHCALGAALVAGTQVHAPRNASRVAKPALSVRATPTSSLPHNASGSSVAHNRTGSGVVGARHAAKEHSNVDHGRRAFFLLNQQMQPFGHAGYIDERTLAENGIDESSDSFQTGSFIPEAAYRSVFTRIEVLPAFLGIRTFAENAMRRQAESLETQVADVYKGVKSFAGSMVCTTAGTGLVMWAFCAYFRTLSLGHGPDKPFTRRRRQAEAGED